MPATVMPTQHPLWGPPRLHHRQNAFYIGGNALVSFFIADLYRLTEEISRRHLFTVTNHNSLFCTAHRAKSFRGRDLTRFIENHKVKRNLPLWQIGGHRHWAHHKHRLGRSEEHTSELQSRPHLV